MSTIYADTKTLPPQLQRLFNGKMVRIEVTEEVHIPADAGTWSGGTRSLYDAVELASGRSESITDHWSPPWFSCRKDKAIHLKAGYAIVHYRTFCGKSLSPRIYIHPDSAAPLLPAPGPTLSDDELQVLDVTCGYKSFARAEELIRRGLSLARIDLAKRSLKSMGYLNAMGAVTTKGRNARPQR